MTIKELCIVNPSCKNCPCHVLCSDFATFHVIPGSFRDPLDKKITESIIKIAKALQEDNND